MMTFTVTSFAYVVIQIRDTCLEFLEGLDESLEEFTNKIDTRLPYTTVT